MPAVYKFVQVRCSQKWNLSAEIFMQRNALIIFYADKDTGPYRGLVDK